MIHHRAVPQRTALALLSCVAFLGMALGCGGRQPTGTPVTFVAEPQEATLRVERLVTAEAASGEVVAQGGSPLSARLELGGAAANYRVIATPTTPEAKENYQVTQVRYDREALLRAAGVVGSTNAPAPPGQPRLPAGPMRVTVPLRVTESSPMNVLSPCQIDGGAR